MYQSNRSQTNNCQTRHQANLIFPITESIVNLRTRDVIKIKKHQKHTKQELSDSFLSEYDSSEESDHRLKRRKNKKSHRKKDFIKLCARSTEKLLMTAYKSKSIKLKLDEDPLQPRFYSLTFVESLDIIFPQYIAS